MAKQDLEENRTVSSTIKGFVVLIVFENWLTQIKQHPDLNTIKAFKPPFKPLSTVRSFRLLLP